jgi:choline-sulfatase
MASQTKRGRRSTRREFLKQAGALAAIGSLPAAAAARRQPGPGRPPNVLFLFPDQHRPDWIQGSPAIPVPTPNLLRLAARGTTFERTLTASPVCAPSRACLASGREYDRCGVRNNGEAYPLDQTTYYERLRDSGYHTMACGKLDLNTGELALGVSGKRFLDEWGFADGIDSPGKGRGFRAYLSAPEGPKDSYYAYLHAQDPQVARRCALDYARRFDIDPELVAQITDRRTWDEAEKRAERARAAAGKDVAPDGDGGKNDTQWRDTDPSPLADEHYCDNWIARNGLALLERAPAASPWLLWINFAGPHPPMDITTSMERRFRGPDRVVDGFAQPHAYRGPIDAAHHLRIRQNYAAMIENIDRWVGVFLDTLEQRGELDSTIIVYASDHGEMLGDHSRWGKSVPYQASAGVPLLVSGPGVRAGHRSQALVSHMDMAATLLDYAGVEVPEDMDSRSLRPVLEGKSDAHRDYVLSGLKDWRLASDGRYKWVTGFEKGEDLVFDLVEDPHEDRNLVASPPKEALALRDVLREQAERAGARAGASG